MTDIIAFDPDDPATWTRYAEDTPEGGKIVLVRYPEGYLLRYHGETVWRQDEKPATEVKVTLVYDGSCDRALFDRMRTAAEDATRRGLAAFDAALPDRSPT